jgi:hypothetical protein
MEVLPSAFASNDAHRVDKVAPCGGCLRASAVGGLGCVGSQMACVGGFCDAGVSLLLPRSCVAYPQFSLTSWLLVPWMVVSIRAKSIPDADDVDAREQCFPPWRRH